MRHSKKLILVSFLAGIVLVAQHTHAQTPGVPEWARGTVWYQILIDRFANGDPANDPTGKEVLGDSLYQWNVSSWTGNWFDITIEEKLYNKDFYPNAYLRQYGGDFAGIQQRLGYIRKLGVGALMLSPVFSSASSHKYDANSFHHICTAFGHRNGVDTSSVNRENPDDPKTWTLTASDRDFISLVKTIHDSGMKVVVDAQFVHVSPRFWAFNDLLREQERSKYGNWFVVREWDKAETPFHSEFTYDAMWDVKAFPKFRTDSSGLAAGPKNYVFAATRRWMDPDGDGIPSDGIDGWRIVLTSSLPDRFWTEWVELVKTINPNAIVIAEWTDAVNPPPSCFDVIYSKKVARGISGALVSHALYPTQFDDLLYQNGKAARDQDAALTLVDDMETDRLSSQCMNTGIPFEKGNTPQRNPEYLVRKPDESARRLQKQALTMQFTIAGAPVIYYGDEAGMWGADDPDCRKPMLWPDLQYAPECSINIDGDETRYPVAFDSSVYGWYQTLLGLRKQHIALSYGTMQTLIIDDVNRIYVFKRESGSDRVWVAMNASDEQKDCTFPVRELKNGTRLVDPLHHVDFVVRKGRLSLVLPPRTVSVIVPVW